jgi:5-methylcytosine-specific restriction enzyme subunit McrC
MLAYTSGLKALRRNRSRRTLHSGAKDSLFDFIALLLADATDRVVQEGLLHDYVLQEADLPVLRGRLRVSEQVRKRFGRVDRLECRYDDHLSDVPENQLLAAALEACYARVADQGVRLRIHRLHTLFHKTCDLRHTDVQTLLEPMRYHRLNAYYGDAHELARLILRALSVDDLLALGKVDSFAFLLDMNQLFEAFVEKLVRQLIGRDGRVHAQFRDRSILWDVTRGKPYGQIRPDLLIESHDEPPSRLVLDAKYKLYDEKKIGSADIYQSFLYAFAYAMPGTLPQSLLIYPAGSTRSDNQVIRVKHRSERRLAQIEAVGIHLPTVFNELMQQDRPHLQALQTLCLHMLTSTKSTVRE